MGSVYFFRNTCSDHPDGRPLWLEAWESFESLVMFTEIALLLELSVTQNKSSANHWTMERVSRNDCAFKPTDWLLIGAWKFLGETRLIEIGGVFGFSLSYTTSLSTLDNSQRTSPRSSAARGRNPPLGRSLDYLRCRQWPILFDGSTNDTAPASCRCRRLAFRYYISCISMVGHSTALPSPTCRTCWSWRVMRSK